MRKVYLITYRGYTYALGSVSDWILGETNTKNVMAESSLAAIDYFRNAERGRVEIQNVTHICTVDLIAEKK